MSGTPGDRIGPYVLEELLGAGGMGSVWASRDLSTNTRVALKIIRGCEHPEALVASMRAWSRLDHPNIVRTLDCGEDGDVVWVAMELLSGLTLRQHLREEPLSHWTKGLSWVADIADALTHLHARGILHRDLKPSNIILVNGRAVLVDFGLAARVDMEDADTPAPAGTLGYMAPEVLLDGWRLDARADLYSLGCILYELLSGWRAAHAKTPRDVLALLELGPPVRVDALRPEIPREIADLVEALLSPKVASRPGHADRVRAVLTPLVSRPMLEATELPHLLTATRVTRRAPEREMRDVLAHFGRGEGGMWVVTGRAGSGKSRLLQEMLGDSLFREARPDVEALVLRAKATRGEQQTPLGLLSKFWESITTHLGPRGMPDQLARFLHPQEHAPSTRLPPGTSRLALFRGLDGLFRQLLAHREVVLVLDDLQWADELTLEWLRSLLSSPDVQTPLSRGLLVVGTARSFEGVALLDALLDTPGVHHVPIEPMKPEELRAMLRSMLGLLSARDAPAEVIDAIIARAQGSPFQASEMLHVAVRRGALRRRKGQWYLHDEELLIRELAEVIITLLEDLSPEARALAQSLSMLERSVSPALAMSLGDMHRVDELVEAGFLERDLYGRLAFAHDRLREAIAASLSEHERPPIHAHIVDVLRETEQAYPGELAHHRLCAGDHEGALHELLAIARDPVVQSAQPHRALSCFVDVAALDDAHALLDAKARAEVDVERVRLMSFAGDKTEAMEAARSLLDRALEPPHEIELWWCLAHSALAIGEVATAWESIEHALRLWAGLTEDTERQELGGRLFWLHGYMLRERGQFDLAREASERALEFTQATQDLHTRALAHRTIGLIGYDRYTIDEASEHLFESLRLLREVDDRKTSVEVLVDLASISLRLFDREKAATYAEAANTRHMAMFGTHHARALSVLAVLARHHGRFHKAVALNEWACQLFEEQKNMRSLAQTLNNLGVALQSRGDLLESIEVQTRAAQIFEQLERPQSTAVARLNCSTTWMRLGRLEESLQAAREAMQLHSSLGDELGVCMANWNTSLVAGLDGHYERAYQITEEIYPTMLARQRWDVLGYVIAFQGWLLCERGLLDAAGERFDLMQDLLASTAPQRIHIVRCLTLRGRYLRLIREHSTAMSVLTEARELASSGGAAYKVGHIDCEIAALANDMGDRLRAQVLLDRAQRLCEILACEDRSWLGRGVIEVASMLSR